MVGLKPYTVYRVLVAAATGAGTGPFSDHTDTRTFGDVPEVKVQLTGLRAMCPTGLVVEWVELNSKLLNGPIEDIYLIVNYTNLDSDLTNSLEVKYYNGNTVSNRFYSVLAKCRGGHILFMTMCHIVVV